MTADDEDELTFTLKRGDAKILISAAITGKDGEGEPQEVERVAENVLKQIPVR